MARTRSFTDMADDAYRLADEENNTLRFPYLSVYRWVNQGIAELYDLLVAARGYAYYGVPFLTLSSVTRSTPSTANTVTFSGTARQRLTIVVKITDVSTPGSEEWDYSLDGGVTYSGTPAVISVDPVALGTSGVYVAFRITGMGESYVLNATYTTVAQDLLTVANQVGYALPDDFYKLHNLYVGDASGSRYLVETLTQTDEPGLLAPGSFSGDGPGFYQLRSGYLDILPTPSGVHTVVMNYVPSAPVLMPGQSFDGINGWEDYASMRAAKFIALKNEDFDVVQTLNAEMGVMKQRIQGLAPSRDIGRPERMQDTRNVRAYRNMRRGL